MPTKLRIEKIKVAEITRTGITADTDHRPMVLVVDDERLIADSLAVILTNQGYAAMAEYDAESALESARLIPPDLLITDVAMPGMSGIDLAIEMKSLVPDCRILLFSGQAASVDLLAASRRAGHDFDILAKPVHPAELLARIAVLDVRVSEAAVL